MPFSDTNTGNFHFASAAVAVDSSHMSASSSTSWSRFSPPSNFVNGLVLTMWFMVCRWPQSQGRLKPGCRIVGSVTIVWLTTEADDQSSLHCVIVSTDVMSDHIGRRDASRGGGCSKTSACTGQFGWSSMEWITSWISAFFWKHQLNIFTEGPLFLSVGLFSLPVAEAITIFVIRQ